MTEASVAQALLEGTSGLWRARLVPILYRDAVTAPAAVAVEKVVSAACSAARAGDAAVASQKAAESARQLVDAGPSGGGEKALVPADTDQKVGKAASAVAAGHSRAAACGVIRCLKGCGGRMGMRRGAGASAWAPTYSADITLLAVKLPFAGIVIEEAACPATREKRSACQGRAWKRITTASGCLRRRIFWIYIGLPRVARVLRRRAAHSTVRYGRYAVHRLKAASAQALSSSTHVGGLQARVGRRTGRSSGRMTLHMCCTLPRWAAAFRRVRTELLSLLSCPARASCETKGHARPIQSDDHRLCERSERFGATHVFGSAVGEFATSL